MSTATTEKKKPKGPKGDVFIEDELCKGCGFCIEFCPLHILAFSEKFNTKGYHPPKLIDETRCSGCDICGLFCPDFAIYGVKKK
ncbi:indolepyruvate ferredoxin oxidoreductase subunit alpha [candidate division KSB1 bacterium]